MMSNLPYDEPCFVISVAARIVGVNTQTLRYYESLGLVQPHRTRGNQRVYSRRDVERVRRMRGLIDDPRHQPRWRRGSDEAPRPHRRHAGQLRPPGCREPPPPAYTRGGRRPPLGSPSPPRPNEGLNLRHTGGSRYPGLSLKSLILRTVVPLKIAPGHRAMSSRGPSEGRGAGSASTMPTDDAIFIPLFPIPRYGARAPEPVEILRLPPPARVENTSASARWSGQRSLRVYCALAPRAELRPAAWGCGANGRGRASGGREAAG